MTVVTEPGTPGPTADDASLDLIFRKAQSHKAWKPEPVSDELLREVYDLAK